MTGAPIDLRDARFRRDVVRLHRHGPRTLHELLAELGARHLIRSELEQLVAKYARLDPAALEAAGGPEWPR